jgi:tRNA G46 methylase TrmB
MNETNHVNMDLLQLIPADARIIIEFGCGTGATGAEYKQINPNCLYVGIEQNADRAKIAEQKLDVAIATDFNTLDLSTTEITAGTVDCILFNQVFSPHYRPVGDVKTVRQLAERRWSSVGKYS